MMLGGFLDQADLEALNVPIEALPLPLLGECSGVLSGLRHMPALDILNRLGAGGQAQDLTARSAQYCTVFEACQTRRLSSVHNSFRHRIAISDPGTRGGARWLSAQCVDRPSSLNVAEMVGTAQLFSMLKSQMLGPPRWLRSRIALPSCRHKSAVSVVCSRLWKCSELSSQTGSCPSLFRSAIPSSQPV